MKKLTAKQPKGKTMKKLTAKQLLREVKSLKKQASSGFNKPEPIEYEDEYELNRSIDTVLNDILDGFGAMGATDVIVKGDTAYVKVEGEVELDIKKVTDEEVLWWGDEDFGKDLKFVKTVLEDIVSKLPKGWTVSRSDGYQGWSIFGPGFDDMSNLMDAWVFNFPSPTWPGGWIDHGNGNLNQYNFLYELTNNYNRDIAIMAKWIAKEFKKYAK